MLENHKPLFARIWDLGVQLLNGHISTGLWGLTLRLFPDLKVLFIIEQTIEYRLDAGVFLFFMASTAVNF